MHEGLSSTDRRLVESLFDSGAIQVNVKSLLRKFLDLRILNHKFYFFVDLINLSEAFAHWVFSQIYVLVTNGFQVLMSAKPPPPLEIIYFGIEKFQLVLDLC